MNLKRLLSILLLTTAPALAQDPAGVPPLDVGEVTITGTRVIKLPPARKGEVVDSSVYLLPVGDTLIFGERISNFGGPGGSLPGYREFDRPASAHVEGSIGTYVSPRVMAHGEYSSRMFDVMGTIDYRGTAGHIDSARASSLLLDLRGGLLLGGDDPTAPRVRVTAGIDRIGDGYILYGNSLAPFDRTRTATRIDAMLASAQDALLDYDFYFHLEHVGVDDALRDTASASTASTPGFGVTLAAGNDTLRARVGVDYQISTLQYGGSSRTPNWVAARGQVEWHPQPALSITAGLLYAGGQFSDSGTTELFSFPVALRYQATPTLSLFAAFAPELRAPSYRNRIMRSPYVDRRIVLRPERVPVSVAAGVRLGAESLTLEGRVRFETAENTPVVTADTAIRGALGYGHVDSRTLAIGATAQSQIAPGLAMLLEAEIRSAVDVATDEQLPMVPQITARVRGDHALSDAIGLNATLRYESARRASLGDVSRELDARMLLDAGATYQFAPAIGIFAEATNLLGSDYELWDGYGAPGLELRVGARVLF